MRQVWISRAGPPEVLQVREAPDPEAAAGQVRIRVKAAGINFADLMARVGLYPDAPKIPCVVGYEVSGVIDQVGAGVTGLRGRRPRLRDAQVRRLLGCRRARRRAGLQASWRDDVRGGRRAPGRLPHGVQHDALHRERPPRVERPDSLGGRGGRHRGDSARQDARVHHPRHRLEVEARLPARARVHAPDRLAGGLRRCGARDRRRSRD